MKLMIVDESEVLEFNKTYVNVTYKEISKLDLLVVSLK